MNANVKNMKTLGWAAAAAVGATSGSGNRARTMQSKRDKARCPRRMRRTPVRSDD